MVLERQRFGLLGVASDAGGITKGSADGPRELRRQGLSGRIKSLGHWLQDFGDVAPGDEALSDKERQSMGTLESAMHNAVQVYTACRNAYAATSRLLQEGLSPIILGGDHSISLGTVAAVSDFYKAKGQKIGLIWIDAHADLNTWESTPSHCYFGTPIAVLSGVSRGLPSALQKYPPSVSLEQTALVGLRSVDPEEREIIRKSPVKAITMKEIDRYGIGTAIEEAIAHAGDGTDGFIVSFDIDVCDPPLVPGTGTPQRGGLTFRESHLALELLYDSKKMLSFELVEFNPHMDVNQTTADFCLNLIESALGKAIL